MKLNLGKTPEQLATEEAEKRKARELEIQKATLERQQKIEALHSKQKMNKIIILSASGLLTAVLLVFGTYNTFFKKDLSIDDVKQQVNAQTATMTYPTEGLDNYIRDIIQPLFNSHIGVDQAKYQSVVVDKNSVYISKVKKINSIFSQVYFMADVISVEKDVEVTDTGIIELLKRNGLRSSATTTYSSMTQSSNNFNTPVSSENETSDNTSDAGNSESNQDNNSLVDSSTSSTEENTAESSAESSTTQSVPQTSTQTTPNSSTTDKSVTLSNGTELIEYYMTSNGTYMQKGKTITTRYMFMLPVEYYYNYNEQNTPISSGYKAAGTLELYSLQEVDIYDEPEETHQYFAFNEDDLVDEATLASAKQTVDKILSDIYAGTVLPQDFVNARKFNTYNATYVQMNSFYFYKTTNALGYNAVVNYIIKTPQGFNYTTTAYLVVEPNNTTWKITNMS